MEIIFRNNQAHIPDKDIEAVSNKLIPILWEMQRLSEFRVWRIEIWEEEPSRINVRFSDGYKAREDK